MAGSFPVSNCLHCKAPFVPDPRNQGRQRFCSQPDCRAVSKRSSQKAWLARPANADYFKGSQNVQRVREWRARHPGYWKRSRRVKAPPSEVSPTPEAMQPVDPQTSKGQLSAVALQDPWPPALQDPWGSLHPMFIGFLSLQMGTALQEDIHRQCDFMAAKGRDILRHGAGGFPASP